MKNFEAFKKNLATVLIGCLVIVSSVAAQQRVTKRNPLLATDTEFFKSEEARRIGDRILAFQRCTGGWPKNIDMARSMSDAELSRVIKDKSRRNDSTTDNGATTMQMGYLARLYRQTGDMRYRDAFRRGMEFLLDGQYENGGWPQFWPEMRDYQVHITYNDDAMVHTLRLIRDVRDKKEPYGGDLGGGTLDKRLKKAFDKGIECILNTQIVSAGRLTVWCQQHDTTTLKPALARAYELPSYCTQESAVIVELLMELPDPDERIKQAVHGAMRWFDGHKIVGMRYERPKASQPDSNACLVEDPQAPEIWARFYDLEHGEPFVCDRDGVPHRRLEEIGTERRNGYSWYNNRPAKLLKLYNRWADKYDSDHKVDLKWKIKKTGKKGAGKR